MIAEARVEAWRAWILFQVLKRPLEVWAAKGRGLTESFERPPLDAGWSMAAATREDAGALGEAGTGVWER